MNLYPYQQTGAAFLAGRKRALLADDMGLGKTAQAIAAATQVDAEKILVICPASVRENWRREIERFAPGKISRWRVESYDSARSNFGFLLDIGYDLIVIDEAHYLKSATAKRTQAIFGPKCDGVGGLVEKAKYVFLLSGTPMPNHPAELWPMLRSCAPETILSARTGKPWSYWQFVKGYCKTRNNGFGEQIVGGKNLDQLKSALQPFMLRRLKEEVMPDLPPIRFAELFVHD